MDFKIILLHLIILVITTQCISQSDTIQRTLSDEELENIYGKKDVITDGRGRMYRSLDLDIGGTYQINSFYYKLRFSKHIEKHFSYIKRYGLNLEYSPWEKTLGANLFFSKNPFNKNRVLQILIQAGGEVGYYTNFNDVNKFAFKPFISYSDFLIYILKPCVFVSNDFKTVEYNIQFSLLIYLPIKEVFFPFF